MALHPMVKCDVCGLPYSIYELVETVEEYLCEHCASGVGPDGEEWEPNDWDDGGEEYSEEMVSDYLDQFDESKEKG